MDFFVEIDITVGLETSTPTSPAHDGHRSLSAGPQFKKFEDPWFILTHKRKAYSGSVTPRPQAVVRTAGVSNSRPAGQLLGRARHGGGALQPSKRRRCPGRPRDERPTTTTGVEYLMQPSLTQTLLPAAPSSMAAVQFQFASSEAHLYDIGLEHSLAKVIHALVTSCLDYCNVLYVGLPLKTVQILQLVQNKAARLLMGTDRYSHITPVLYQLHWLPVGVQAQFNMLVLTYKALNGLGPGYLKERLGLYTVNTVYGDTIVLPCHLEVPNDLMFGKWKYEIANKASTFIAFRSATKKTVQYDDVPEYKDRLSLSENYTLSISNARIGDEKKFVCMLITENNILEQATIVKVFKQPSQPEITNRAMFLETERLKMSILAMSAVELPGDHVGATFEVVVGNGRYSDSLPELMEIVSDLVLRTPRMLVLGDFNLHAETGLTGAAPDFMASMTAMGLSQHVTGPTHERGHTLDLVLLTGQEEGDLRLGECITKDGYPQGNLTWFKNGIVLQPVEGAVVINEQTNVAKASGLFTVISSLEYKPMKDDTNAQFTCTVTYFAPTGQETIRSESVVFDIHYPTEKVTIEVLSERNTIKEGDNITLKCSGNGNPPPQEFLFYIPGESEPIRGSSHYILTDVRRNATGEYKCSLTDGSLKDSTTITVHYLDLSLSPSGEVIKQIGEALPVSCTISSSRNATVFWLK
ncbi:hypothetical protein EYD10_03390, partial [Varanus komodoensis]